MYEKAIMRKIGIICAMTSELELLQDTGFGDNVRCVLSGMGKVNAALCAEGLIRDFGADAVISTGVAGSFAEGVREGDMIIARCTAYHDMWCGYGCAMGRLQGFPQRFRTDDELFDTAVRFAPQARQGLIITGDQFYISEDEDRRQKELYPDALAVDMESAAIAQVCRIREVPFLSVRLISDTHNDGRQDEHYRNFWERDSREAFGPLADMLLSLTNTYGL